MVARFSCPLILLLLSVSPAAAQIIPADSTQVKLNGNRFDITQGARSRDGANLFHSFTQFGLAPNQTANFITNPAIQTILARVNGGQPSIIQGLLQVSGGKSNLVLMNPSGILFGPTAALNVPASFTATTAGSIGFGKQGLSLFSNTYADLTGSPTHLAFPFFQPGAIVNAGNLSVPNGNLMLIGGTVVSTGNLSAPNGTLLAQSVPGQTFLQLGSLELRPLNADALYPIAIATLPELLTGGKGRHATGLSVNPKGQVELTGSGLSVEPGDVSVRSLQSKTAMLSTTRNLTLFESQLTTTGKLNLFADRTLRVRDSRDRAVLVRSGGDLTLRGTQSIDILALNHLSKTPFVGGGNLSLISNGIISGDAHFASRGSFRLRTLTGSPGKFVSLYDPIISTLGDVSFGDYTGASLKVEAVGSISGGNITITSPDTALVGSDPDIAILTSRSAVILRAGVASLANPQTLLPESTGSTTFTNGTSILPASVIVGNLTTDPTNNALGEDNVIITAPGNVTTGNITTSTLLSGFNDLFGGGVSITAGDSIVTGAIDTSATLFGTGDFVTGGTVRLTATNGNIQFDSINTRAVASGSGNGDGGNVQLLASNGRIQGIGFTSISPADTIYTQSDSSSTGLVEIRHGGGISNLPFSIGDATINGTAGAITTDATIAAPTSFGTVGIQTQGNATFNFINVPPTLTANSSLPPVAPGQTLQFTNRDLGAVITDLNNDQTQLLLTIPRGATLTINGTPIQGNTAIVSLFPETPDAFEYTPPPGTTGSFPAFTLTATDVVSNSLPVTVQASVFDPVNPSIPVEPTTPNTQIEENPIPEIDDSFESKAPQKTSTDPQTPQSQSLLDVDPFVSQIEQSVSASFEGPLALEEVKPKELPDVRADLSNVESSTGVRPALVYALFVPTDITQVNPSPSDSDVLELFIVSAQGIPVRKRIPGATRGAVVKLAQDFQRQVSDRKKVLTTTYLAPAQQLYQWLIAPLEAEFQSRKIQSLVFITDAGLRSLPFAALHDGKGFLVERFSTGLMPSISLTDTRYRDIRRTEILAMGASAFKQSDQLPLPSVPLEIKAVSSLWQGKAFLNDSFTLENLKAQRSRNPYGIIHLATHAEFQSGALQNSYIQLSDAKLQLDQIRQLGWNNPPVELLVLSACRTALGDKEAELGFAGLAVKSGVKTAMASLWYVDDSGTLTLMQNFYQVLKKAPIKAEALRQAQLNLLNGKTAIRDRSFAHPYYWSSFTLIGSPW